MAAAHFNQIAKERGLPFLAVSRGIAADSSIPTDSRRFGAGGVSPVNDVPLGLNAEEANGASKVFAFDEVPTERRGSADVTYWSTGPPPRKTTVRRGVQLFGISTTFCRH
jgi:hypothetical protein